MSLENKLEPFRKLGDYICSKNGVSQCSFFVGEPHKGEKLFLRYKKEKRDFTIEYEDGVKLSPKLFSKILPEAIGIMVSCFQANEKQLLKRQHDINSLYAQQV